MNTEQAIPDNIKGKAVNLEQTAELNNEEEASQLYELACDRLQRPTCWHELGGKMTAKFTPVDQQQQELDRPIKVHDYIRVDLPAPGTDWVQVAQLGMVEGQRDQFSLTLEVTAEPGKEAGKVDHFFDKGASSTFIIERKQQRVVASYHGRNETPNTDNLRNAVVALGAIAGLSELQWFALLKGLLSQE
jgi:hypothetical protein